MNNEELTKRVIELDEKTIKHAEQIKTCFNQIEDTRALTGSVQELATSVRLLTEAQKGMNDKIDALSKDMDELKQRPVKHWNTLTTVMLTAIASAIVTRILTGLGLF